MQDDTAFNMFVALERTKQIYHSIQQDILVAPKLAPLHRAVIVACMALCAGALVVLPLMLLISFLAARAHP